MDLWQEFHGPNAAYILDLYERFRQDPTSVDPGAQALFQQWQPNGDRPGRAATERRSEASGVSISADKVMAVVNLATAIREYGHLAARIDPLGLANPPGDPALHTSAHALTDDDLRALSASLVGGPAADGAANALEAIGRLRAVYSSTIGYDLSLIHI